MYSGASTESFSARQAAQRPDLGTSIGELVVATVQNDGETPQLTELIVDHPTRSSSTFRVTRLRFASVNATDYSTAASSAADAPSGGRSWPRLTPCRGSSQRLFRVIARLSVAQWRLGDLAPFAERLARRSEGYRQARPPTCLACDIQVEHGIAAVMPASRTASTPRVRLRGSVL